MGFKCQISSTSWMGALSADAIGSPVLGVIATSLHFYSARLVDSLDRKLRCISVVLLGAVAISVFVGSFFLLERLFLVPSPTYFEAVVQGRSGKISGLYAPPLSLEPLAPKRESNFDPIATPHVVLDEFEYAGSALSARWAPPANMKPAVAAYSVFDCSPKKLVEAVRYFKAEDDQFTDGPLDIRVPKANVGLVVPTAKWRGFLLSGVRELDADHSFLTEVSYDAKKKTVMLSDFLAQFKKISVQPNTDSLAIGLYTPSNGRLRVAFSIGKSTFERTLVSAEERRGARCMARVIRDGKQEIFQKQSPTALIFVLSNPGVKSLNAPGRIPALELLRGNGYFEYGPIQHSDPYSETDAPYAIGDLRFFKSTEIQFLHARMYGEAIDLESVECTERVIA